MRFIDVDIESLPSFVEGADAYHKPNDMTRLWGWPGGGWCLLRAGDEKALFWEDGDLEPGLREPVRRESECDHVARLFAECERQQAV